MLTRLDCGKPAAAVTDPSSVIAACSPDGHVKYILDQALFAAGEVATATAEPARAGPGCLGAFLYFLPTIIAFRRSVPNAGSALVINLFLGRAFVGWVVSLAMACRSRLPEPPRWGPPVPGYVPPWPGQEQPR